MIDVAVIDDPRAATVALDPVRSRLLDELAKEPASASEVAATLGLPRQKVNYHLRTLEQHGLVELAGVEAHGGITERRMRAIAARFVVSPAAISDGDKPERIADRLSAGYLVALGGRLVNEVARLTRLAGDGGARLPTFSIDTEIGFASAADRAAFADELTATVTELAAKYHHDDGRPHRLILAAHPTPPNTTEESS